MKIRLEPQRETTVFLVKKHPSLLAFLLANKTGCAWQFCNCGTGNFPIPFANPGS
jgi:hypothetical protein